MKTTQRTTRTMLIGLPLLILAACATRSSPSTDASTTPASSGAGHGAIAGATEAAEPPLHLVALNARGQSSMLNLLDGTRTSLGTVPAAEAVTTDGRYVFAADETGVSIIDSGVWTWDHVDHFHYYQAQPRLLDRVAGNGVAAISTGMLSTAGTTGIFFPTSGEAVLLENKDLSEGRVIEHLRVRVTPHAGLVAPLGEGALVSQSDSGDQATRLDAVDAQGATLDSIDCQSPSGTVTTRVGLVVGCADGAVIATLEDATPVLRHVPYPEGAAAAATSFAARKGRPTVAGMGDGSGVWLFDSREASWRWLATTTPVITATAVDDADEHVLAVGQDGTVQVYDGTSGEQLAVTEPLLATTLADPALAGTVALVVDGQRAYVNDAADGVVYEIDYADRGRVARALKLPVQPVHLAETGR